MDSEVNLYLLRAEDEFLLSQKDLQISICYFWLINSISKHLNMHITITLLW